MSHRHIRATLIFILALSFSKYGAGQNKYPKEYREWEATGFVGTSAGNSFQFPTLVTSSSGVSSRTVGMSYDSGYLVGVRINQNLGDYWAADLEYSFSNQHLTFTNLSPNIQTLKLNQYLHNFTYDVSYLALPRTQRFRPFADAGVGGAFFYLPGRVRKDARELDLSLRNSWEFVFSWGGGFKYLVTDEVAVGFDVKDRISRIPSYGLPSEARIVNGRFQPGFAPHGTMNNWQFNFGVTFQWDEP